MTERVTIRTQWFWRKGEEGPELLTAWDDYTVDNNPQGFEEACARDFESVKTDDQGFGPRMIDINAEWGPIEAAFQPVEVEATSEVIES